MKDEKKHHSAVDESSSEQQFLNQAKAGTRMVS